MKKRKPIVLAILDGWGIGANDDTNAIHLAKTPAYDFLRGIYPWTALGAAGSDVGLDNNQASGSETGHLNIGAGRIVKQDSRTISESINTGEFFRNPALLDAVRHVKKNKSHLHLMGLLGNMDSPHMNPYHLEALLVLAKGSRIKNVYIHFFTDGRDAHPKKGLEQIEKWKRRIKHKGVGEIATLVGRFWAMDRAKNWDRLEAAYNLLVNSHGERFETSEEAITANYAKGITDEYIELSVITKYGKPVAKIKHNDAVIFFNSRADRAREFTKLFVLEKSDETKLPAPRLKNLHFTGLTSFGDDLPMRAAFGRGELLAGTLPQAFRDLRQLYIAEKEKYAHVTFFMNGGSREPIAGEDHVILPSEKVKNYKDKPEMSSAKLTEHVLAALKDKKYDFITVNYANPDMVGHTGDMKAAIKAVEVVDKCVKKLHDAVQKAGGTLIVTSDHGNADCMWDKNGKHPMTFHTKNPVPFIVCGERFKGKRLRKGGILANVAPTLCEIASIEKLKEMTSDSLL